MRIQTAYSASSVCDHAHSTVSTVASTEPAVISPRAPWPAIQRPTGRPNTAPASAAERGDRAFTREMAREIQLPTPIEMSQTFGDLEYERAPFLGLLVDLNGDGVPEYLVRAAPARCSERGCPYAIFDGASFHSLEIGRAHV